MDKITEAYLNTIISESAKYIESNFEDEIKQAIDDGTQIQVDYTNKAGKQSKITLTPTRIEQRWGGSVCIGMTPWGKELALLIGSMGKHEDTPAPANQASTSDSTSTDESLMQIEVTPDMTEELLNAYPFLKGKNVYLCIGKKYLAEIFYFIPLALVDGKVLCDKVNSRVKESSYDDGDYDDGRSHSWTTVQRDFIMNDKVGRVLLTVNGENLELDGKPLKFVDVNRHIYSRFSTNEHWGRSHRLNKW